MLKELTNEYIQAFKNKNLDDVASLLADTFTLEDPVVKKIVGKKAALAAVQNIFNSCNSLDFYAKNIYQDNQTTIIEFILKLDNTTLTGTDIIEWHNKKMQALRAYLDIPKGD